MFEDLLRRLGIGEFNQRRLLRRRRDATGEVEIHSTNPATGQAAAVGVIGLDRRLRAGRRAGGRRVSDLADGPAAAAGRGRPPDRRRPCAPEGRPGLLVTLETGKIRTEGEGEVQEMIDMCDFAVGLSRQLYGLTIASERARHRMIEQWQPLGPIGIITAFNFPVAVWAWNAMIAAVCGDTMIWKPSPLTPL